MIHSSFLTRESGQQTLRRRHILHPLIGGEFHQGVHHDKIALLRGPHTPTHVQQVKELKFTITWLSPEPLALPCTLIAMAPLMQNRRKAHHQCIMLFAASLEASGLAGPRF